MPILGTIKFVARKVERFFIYRILSLDDTPHRIALGVAVGIFVTWTPSMPFQMVLVVALSWLLGANKFVGVPLVWISNPATLVPIYAPNYIIGCWIMGRSHNAWSVIGNAISFQGSWWDRIYTWYSTMTSIFWELWIGSLVVALILGVMTYFAMYRMIVVYRGRLHHRQELAAVRKQGRDETTPQQQ